ncbi:concanavalin A-like lectin/glucanase domain-containing protein [Trametes polyzona]|nr:concanavalin A-like lectin/glucanase domain-containing protein [Trametes polyzona]
MRTALAALSFASLLILPASSHFVLTDEYIGRDFLQSWNWETFDDPTHGRVNYVSLADSLNGNLTYATDQKFVMRADSHNVVSPTSRGRDSVRIISQRAYDEAVVVLDLTHMPEGCGTWPAFWSLSQRGPWPQGGEIDIIEGVNQSPQNLASLHTTPNCTMQPPRLMTGTATSTNCDANVNYNQGCGVSFAKPASYGADFNRAGGGYYAMVRTKTEGVRVWFWSRYDPAVPPEIRYGPLPDFFGQKSVYPSASWGQPEAYFPLRDQCDYGTHFDPHAFVFDLTFCGDWAGSDYPNSGCPGTCDDFVNNNPQAFANAYWEINSLRVYTPQ